MRIFFKNSAIKGLIIRNSFKKSSDRCRFFEKFHKKFFSIFLDFGRVGANQFCASSFTQLRAPAASLSRYLEQVLLLYNFWRMKPSKARGRLGDRRRINYANQSAKAGSPVSEIGTNVSAWQCFNFCLNKKVSAVLGHWANFIKSINLNLKN